MDAYIAIWNDRDYSRIPAVVSESFVMTDLGAPDGEVHGPEGVEEWIGGFVSAFCDLRMEINERLVGDDTATFEATFTGTHDGEFDGLAPNGREVELQFVDRMKVEDGKIQAEWVYYDTQEFARQFGQVEE